MASGPSVPDRHPFESCVPELAKLHAPDSPVGITLRKADARKRLKELLEAEEGIAQQQCTIAKIDDDIERFNAEHEFNMQHLIQFGITLDEREEMIRILEDVSETGGMSLREAAKEAHARVQRKR